MIPPKQVSAVAEFSATRRGTMETVAGGREKGEPLYPGDGVSVLQDEKVLEADGGGECP